VTAQPTARFTALRWPARKATGELGNTCSAQGAKGRTKKGGSAAAQTRHRQRSVQLLTRPSPIDDDSDLRPARHGQNLTLAAVANHFGVPLITVSRLERAHQRNDALANNYRQWLTAP
jgi:hypothetical protein